MNTTATILLVDDLEENLLAMSALLRAPEVRVLMARSGAEALEIVLVNEVALALVDVQMPDMDGFELAELMRGSERTKHVPIVFITAGAHDRQRQFKGFNFGAVDFLYKPVEPHVLTNKVAVFVELFLQKKALLRVSALQNAIFNSANFSSIATDANGVIQIFNVGAERMLGYSAIEVLNKITPADISDPQELVERARVLSLELDAAITPGFEALVFKASRGIEDIYELTYIRKDGSRFPAVVSVTALRDAQGAIIGYLLIGSDNTARKLAEEALIKSAAELTAVQTAISEAAIVAVTDLTGKIEHINDNLVRISKYSREELIGQNHRLLNSGLHPKEFFREMWVTIARGKVWRNEIRNRAKDGSLYWVDTTITPIRDERGTVIKYMAVRFDVTARKRVEVERREIEKLLQQKNTELEAAIGVADKANRAKSDFLSSMSHELRTPLNAILGFAQLIERDAPSPSPGEKRSVDQILKAGWYLLALINEILDLATIESNRATLFQEPVSLHEVLLECQGMVETQANTRGIGMSFPHIEKHCFVFADRIRIKQVLVNLLSNAIKYNRVAGSLSVESALCPPHSIRIGVRDTGDGLTPEQLTQLFVPFNRLGREGGTEEGTGIGLVVTKRLVELMGGRIGVDSVVGVGSVFWFELALTTAALPDALQAVDAARAALAPAASAADPLVHTVLYVEDNPANLELVEQLIARRADLHLLTATNGPAGIALARTSLPKVILMDINLPGMSGIDAMRILRADPLTAHIPVVALSASASKIDIDNGIKAGFFSYVTKPIRVADFMKSLDEAQEHSNAR